MTELNQGFFTCRHVLDHSVIPINQVGNEGIKGWLLEPKAIVIRRPFVDMEFRAISIFADPRRAKELTEKTENPHLVNLQTLQHIGNHDGGVVIPSVEDQPLR